MGKQELLYEGKAKQVYATDDKDIIIMHYKDDATAGNGAKHAQFAKKGELNNKITTIIYNRLIKAGIPTHYIKTLNDFGFDYFGYSIPRSLNEALNLGYRSTSTKEIFKKLYAFNVAAFNNRYEADCDIDVEMPKDYKTTFFWAFSIPLLSHGWSIGSPGCIPMRLIIVFMRSPPKRRIRSSSIEM